MSFEKRILHLGLGRFHRGHQAVYYQKMKNIGDSRWGVISMTMRSPEARDHLRSVKLRYPVLELSAKQSKTIWIESIQDVLCAHEDFEAVLKAFQNPQLEIITLTVTEKGYDLDGSGKLDFERPGIMRDIDNFNTPHSTIGLISLGLRLRKQLDLDPVTVISCDNIRDNGHKLRDAVIEYTERIGFAEDALWIKQKIKFPNTMVDRIVPSLLPEKISALENEFKLPTGSELIGTESFCQWVIEDNFAQKRPDWEKVGVQFVSEVRPFEEIKLKLLNASHSYLAYAGLLRGYQFVHEAIADLELRRNVMELYREVIPTLMIPEGFDIKAYTRDLISRFENNKLPHQLKQIAMDGSQKLPQRIFSSINAAKDQNLKHETMTMVIKEWINFCEKSLQSNAVIEDPEYKFIKDLYDSGDWKMKLIKSRLFEALKPFSDSSFF